ncbi:MAG: hypothetical protein SOX79_00790 [Candidatus Egerieousia sp.]|nr:hypothetical protein [Candidatus Egerieousia sp.]
MVSPRIFPMVPCGFPMVAPRIFPMLSPLIFPMALPSQRHPLPYRGPGAASSLFRAAVSGAAAVSPAQRSGKFFRAAQSGSTICHPAAAPQPGGSHIRPRYARVLAKPEYFSA